MIRYEEKMSEIYGLGRPCSGRSTATLRLFLSYDVCVPFEVPESLGGGWPSHKPFDKRELKLYDHEDTFKYAFTLLPYMPKIQKMMKAMQDVDAEDSEQKSE